MTGADVFSGAHHFRRWYKQGATETEQEEMRNNPSCLCDALVFYETLSVRGEGPDYRWGKRGSGPSRSLLQAVQGEWKPVSRAQIQPSRHTPLQTKQTCLSKEASLHVLGSACPSKFTHSFCLQDDCSS